MEEKITKNNVCQHIEGLLKKMRVGYSLVFSCKTEDLYEIYATSLNNMIQMDFGDSEDFIINFFVRANEGGSILYESRWDSDAEGQDDIEHYIQALIEESRRISKGISKLKIQVEKIQDICDEYTLDMGEFMTIHFNFNDI